MVLKKEIALLVVVAMLLTIVAAMAGGTVRAAEPEPEWVAGAPLAYPIYLAAWVQDADNNMYIFGGRSSLTSPETINASRYDLDTGQHVRLASMPQGVSGAGAAIGDDGRIFVIGGRNASDPALYLDLVQIYDPATDSWEMGAPMPEGATVLNALSMSDGLIYVIGGTNFGGVTGNVQIYDPAADSWSLGSDMVVPCYAGSAIDTGGSILYLGGSNPDFITTYQHVLVYNQGDDWWWTQSMELPEKIASASSIVAQDLMVYITGGGRGDSAYGTNWGGVTGCYALDLSTGDFLELPEMSVGRKYHMAGTDSQGNIVVLGGHTYDSSIGYFTTTSVEKLRVMDLQVDSADEVGSGEVLTVKLDLNLAFAPYEMMEISVRLKSSDGAFVEHYMLRGYVAEGSPAYCRLSIPQDLPSGDYVAEFYKVYPYNYWGSRYMYLTDVEFSVVHQPSIGERMDSQQGAIDALQDQVEGLQEDLSAADDKLDSMATNLLLVMVLAIIAVIVAVVVLFVSLRRKP